MRTLLIAAWAILSIAAAPAASASDATPGPQEIRGSSGVDLVGLDRSVAPGDDFFLYANGAWMHATKIRPDSSYAGPDLDLNRKVQGEVRDLILAGPASFQTRRLYSSFMDERRVDALGARPLAGDLARIAAVKTKRQFAALLGETLSRFGSPLFSVEARPDPRWPDVTAFAVDEDQFGLPDQRAYVQPEFRRQLNAYHAFARRVFSMIGAQRPDRSASALINLEVRMAVLGPGTESGPPANRPLKCLTITELRAYAPGFPWAEFLRAAKVDPGAAIVVDESSAIGGLAKLFANTPLSTLKTWATFHLVYDASPYLSHDFVRSRFQFEKAMNGVVSLQPRWRRGVTFVDEKIGELLGPGYIANYFPPTTKSQIAELAANLKAAMAKRIENADCAAPATKAEALAKLSNLRIMVGYPDRWRDYSSLRISANDLYGNAERSIAFEYAEDSSSVGRSIAMQKWDTSPQAVDAYNDELENKVTAPAGILQPPYFDPSADPAVNYGGIGALIGHEIGHAFDDEGRTIDSHGVVRDWWSPADAKHYESGMDRLSKQFSAFEPVHGLHVDGEATLGENVADLIGLEIALDAYHLSLHGRPAPIIDGLTGDQRFFIAFAQSFREKDRAELTRERLAVDEHAPPQFRVIGAVRNSDAWYDAFHIPPTATYYLAPADRVRIW